MMEPKRKKLVWAGVILVVLLLFGAWVARGNPSDLPIEKTEGLEPLLVEPDSERIPSVSLADTIGWQPGEAPTAAKGLAVSRFAEGLNHPRTMLTLPNGDVLVAETSAPQRAGEGITGFFMGLAMKFVGAGTPSANRIVLLRDADGDGKAETRLTFREKDLDSPSGMAWVDGKLYVANHDAVLAFDFVPGPGVLNSVPKRVMNLPPAGNHWMRNLIASEDGKTLYIAVGSGSNIGENGMASEEGRAAIHELDLATGRSRLYASGLRNPNGMAWNPSSGELWTVVNERDMIGPDLVPDYLTNVPLGAQYGWPWVYWRRYLDWRVKDPVPDHLDEYTRKPEYALGAHTAPLGLLFSAGGNLLGDGFANGAFIARHGSWNRKPPVGYDVVFVTFDAFGNPVGMPRKVLDGFLVGKGGETRGRPTWLAWDKAGGLLVSDDTAGIVWRVASPGAAPSVRPAAVNVARMPVQRSLEGDPNAAFRD